MTLEFFTYSTPYTLMIGLGILIQLFFVIKHFDVGKFVKVVLPVGIISFIGMSVAYLIISLGLPANSLPLVPDLLELFSLGVILILVIQVFRKELLAFVGEELLISSMVFSAYGVLILGLQGLALDMNVRIGILALFCVLVLAALLARHLGFFVKLITFKLYLLAFIVTLAACFEFVGREVYSSQATFFNSFLLGNLLIFLFVILLNLVLLLEIFFGPTRSDPKETVKQSLLAFSSDYLAHQVSFVEALGIVVLSAAVIVANIYVHLLPPVLLVEISLIICSAILWIASHFEQ